MLGNLCLKNTSRTILRLLKIFQKRRPTLERLAVPPLKMLRSNQELAVRPLDEGAGAQ